MLIDASTRKWCSATCRGAGRRKEARAVFAEWLRAPLPERCPDLEGVLLDAAPEGSWWYRLSCPGLGGRTDRRRSRLGAGDARQR